MKSTVLAAILVSSGLVAPLIFFELRFGYSNFPYTLFAVLWLVPAAFVLTAAPLVRAVRAGQGVFAHPISLTARLCFLVLAGLFWVVVVNDQMPCFLGVPNCD
jgi:hypothetical protein